MTQITYLHVQNNPASLKWDKTRMVPLKLIIANSLSFVITRLHSLWRYIILKYRIVISIEQRFQAADFISVTCSSLLNKEKYFIYYLLRTSLAKTMVILGGKHF